MPGRKQSQVTDLMLITCEVLPFRKTKQMEGIIPTLFFPPALARQRISSGEKSVDIVRLVCKGLISGALTPFRKAWHWCFLWVYHILPIITWCRTSLITWIPGCCGSNWADLRQLQSSPGLIHLGRNFLVVKIISCSCSEVGFPRYCASTYGECHQLVQFRPRLLLLYLNHLYSYQVSGTKVLFGCFGLVLL